VTLGPHVVKWTYLLATVQGEGIVEAGSGPITRDEFVLRVDPAFNHLTELVHGTDAHHSWADK
jgi:hypothetical protein